MENMKTLALPEGALAYRDLGKGDPLVFAHGTPSSSEEFLGVMQALQGDFRCIGLDFLGFGASDKPPQADYSLQAHSERFFKFMEALGLPQFHLVVHDFGGPIALKYALSHPERIKSLTIMNSWLWPFQSVEKVPFWQKILMRSSLMRFLYLRANFSAKALVPMAWGKHQPLSKSKHNAYLEKFKTPQDRLGTWAFAAALLDEKESFWQLEKELYRLDQIPTLLLWGAADKLVTQASLQAWRARLPRAQVRILPEVGHFLADEAPELVAPELLSFCKKTG